MRNGRERERGKRGKREENGGRRTPSRDGKFHRERDHSRANEREREREIERKGEEGEEIVREREIRRDRGRLFRR